MDSRHKWTGKQQVTFSLCFPLWVPEFLFHSSYHPVCSFICKKTSVVRFAKGCWKVWFRVEEHWDSNVSLMFAQARKHCSSGVKGIPRDTKIWVWTWRIFTPVGPMGLHSVRWFTTSGDFNISIRCITPLTSLPEDPIHFLWSGIWKPKTKHTTLLWHSRYVNELDWTNRRECRLRKKSESLLFWMWKTWSTFQNLTNFLLSLISPR